MCRPVSIRVVRQKYINPIRKKEGNRKKSADSGRITILLSGISSALIKQWRENPCQAQRTNFG